MSEQPDPRRQTELFDATDPHDRRIARHPVSALAEWNARGVIAAAEVHVAGRLSQLAGETDPSVLLALALAVRAVERGSVCLDLTVVSEVAPDLPWPEPGDWLARVRASPLVAAGVVVVEDDLVYLARYHRLETSVRDDLVSRQEQPAPVVDESALAAAAEEAFPSTGYDDQRAAALQAARQWTTVLTGGPGTGKTTTVAGIVHLLASQSEHSPSIALAAPTGKAAARLQEAVLAESTRLPGNARERLIGAQAATLHRLLGWRRDNTTRFRHHRGNRLGYDVVVVDESSMVDLTMMARLLESIRPDARLLLVGDPDQLTSVGAGAVLGDLVRGYADRPDSPVVALTHTHRFGAGIAGVADALRRGDLDEVLTRLQAGTPDVEFVSVEDPTPLLRETLLTAAVDLREAAEAGDVTAALALMDRHRLLCAHRDGPHGVAHWNGLVESWLAAVEGIDRRASSYAGRPLLMTKNDYALGVYNGETGVVVRVGEDLRAAVAGSKGIRQFAPTRLGDVETMHALTIHKSQGGQADEVTVLLPPPESRLLTRELFYTAVTRARRRLRVVGTTAAVRAAVERRAWRATGLQRRLVQRS